MKKPMSKSMSKPMPMPKKGHGSKMNVKAPKGSKSCDSMAEEYGEMMK